MRGKTVPLASLLPSWELSLQEANRSPKTLMSYLGAADRFIRYCRMAAELPVCFVSQHALPGPAVSC